MQADIAPTLTVIPFDDSYAIEASLLIIPECRKNFVYRSFLMFVLELRSAMDDNCLDFIKKNILDMCLEMLERDGIDNIGFIINEKYHTIRNPNIEGIKDLLAANLKVEDTTDIRNTLQCLRHSIMNEAKKMADCKLSLFFFSSNVEISKLAPTKLTHQAQKNMHLQNYFQEIRKLRATVQEYCIDSRFYTVCYANTDSITLKESQSNFFYDQNQSSSYFDVSLIYSIANCASTQKAFHYCSSFTRLIKGFEDVCALMLYDFHEFSIMLPVKKHYNIVKMQYQHFQKAQKKVQYKGQNNKQNEQEKDSDLSEEDVNEFQMRELKYVKMRVFNKNEQEFASSEYLFLNKQQLDLQSLHKEGYHIVKTVQPGKEKPRQFPEKKKVIRYLLWHFEPTYTSKNVDYHEPTHEQLIKCRVFSYIRELRQIMRRVEDDILRYKRKYVGNKKYEYELRVNEELQFQLRNRVEFIEKVSRQVYELVFKSATIRSQNLKRQMYDLYSSLKTMIDTAQEVIMKTLKKQITNSDISQLAQAINYDKIKSSLKRKLIKRVNSHPKLIDETYDRVDDICSKLDTVALEAKFKIEKSEVGNCMYTFQNFATSLKKSDCIALVFEIERPDSAIADPGRIRIRQVSTMVASVSKFFQIHLYKIQNQRLGQTTEQEIALLQALLKEDNYCSPCQGPCMMLRQSDNVAQQYAQKMRDPYIREMKNKLSRNFGIDPKGYQERWDYWDKVEKRKTFLGIMPLYVCEQNWSVAKLLMKPCMGWTCCGEPLGYAFSQFQTVPFMVLSSLIRSAQQVVYKIQELKEKGGMAEKQSELYEVRHQINLQKHILQRYEDLIKHTEMTCQAIMHDMSQPHFDERLDQMVIQKYQAYKEPINRTIDVISNNSSFLGQLYTALKSNKMPMPTEEEFHFFFKRLIEEELRRETERWNENSNARDTHSQDQAEEAFVNKLLNAHIQKMDKPQYVVMNSQFRDRFESALSGEQVLRTEFQIQRQNLAMMLREGGQFNETQKMMLIEYKRLYQNRVLWMWYIRFRLYQPIDRVKIHKWKCLDLKTSYMLFSMIIQNKRQRRNYKRREAILQGLYADPFDYEAAFNFLNQQYVEMRNKKESKNIVLLNTEKYTKSAEVFAMTPDLDEAAGALMNTHTGKEIVFFYIELKRDGRLMEEKLKMLLRGEYRGVRLMKEGWMMSKKRMGKLRQKYPLVFQRYQYMF